MNFNHDCETFQRIQRNSISQQKSGIRETTLNTENKSPSQVGDEILCHLELTYIV
jgi:hypothetical protein